MKNRIIEFLKSENKSSAQLADEIGVQPSGISHILSGRNNPSLDFVMKMLQKYQFLSSDWLLFGKGSMYKEIKMQTLFDDSLYLNPDNTGKLEKKADKSELKFADTKQGNQKTESTVNSENKKREVVRIVWFYDDYCFEEYFPK